MTLLLVYLFLALSVSFLCSIMEAVLLSVPIPYLQSKKDTNAGAVAMLGYKENIDKPLSAILSLNTVAHTVGAAGVGAQATKVFGEAYFGVVSAVLTILILVVTEIIPKTLGANYNKQLVGPTSQALKISIFITYPLVILSNVLTKWLGSSAHASGTSRLEFSTLAQMGMEDGIFEEKENKIIQNLLRLKKLKVSQIMTPRPVVVTADEDMTLRSFMENKSFLHFSRIPIFEKDRDNITGYVMRAQVFEKLAMDEFDMQLIALRRDIAAFSEDLSLFTAWERMIETKDHLAIAVDQYGGLQGVITLEDIIETLIGLEIVDEKDRVADMQAYAAKRWKEKQKKYKFIEAS